MGRWVSGRWLSWLIGKWMVVGISVVGESGVGGFDKTTTDEYVLMKLFQNKFC